MGGCVSQFDVVIKHAWQIFNGNFLEIRILRDTQVWDVSDYIICDLL